jgi:hypothetical protein
VHAEARWIVLDTSTQTYDFSSGMLYCQVKYQKRVCNWLSIQLCFCAIRVSSSAASAGASDLTHVFYLQNESSYSFSNESDKFPQIVHLGVIMTITHISGVIGQPAMNVFVRGGHMVRTYTPKPRQNHFWDPKFDWQLAISRSIHVLPQEVMHFSQLPSLVSNYDDLISLGYFTTTGYVKRT